MNNTQRFLKNGKELGKKSKVKDAIGYLTNECYVRENLICIIFTIQITDACWDFKEGEIIDIPILGKTIYQCEKMLDELDGSEYPGYNLLSAKRIGNRDFFPLMIQNEFIMDFVEFGEKKANKKLNK
jgi:hypothetical protein